MSHLFKTKFHGEEIVLCLAHNADGAKHEGSNLLEHHVAWTEVQNGTERALLERAGTFAKNTAMATPGVVLGVPGHVGSFLGKIPAKIGDRIGSGKSPPAPTQREHAAVPKAMQPPDLVQCSETIMQESSGSDPPHQSAVKSKKGQKGADEETSKNPAPTVRRSSRFSPYNANASNSSTPKPDYKDEVLDHAATPVKSDSQESINEVQDNTKRSKTHTVWVGKRIRTEPLKSRACFTQNLRSADVLNNNDNKIRMYLCVTNNKITVKAPTEEIVCMYRILVRINAWKHHYYTELGDNSSKVTMDMITKQTMLYTTKGWNAIIWVTDDKIDKTEGEAPANGVKSVEVNAEVAGKTIKRLVCYTEECLNLDLFKKLDIKKKGNLGENERLVLFCLLVYTGWGLYASADEKTSVSFIKGGMTISVTQGGTGYKMFDENTKFTVNVDSNEEDVSPTEAGVQTRNMTKRSNEASLRRSTRLKK